jgi:arsenate reductase
MKITIYHNPGCSKSRKTLELIESHGIEPKIVEYLRQPPDAATLLRLAGALNVPLAELMRKTEADFKDAADTLALDDDAALAIWLHDHPRVLQRPIVVDEDGQRGIVGRPPENVLEILQK